MPRPPAPRNAIEIPLYVYATWGVWPPLYVLLGRPYSDLDERLRPSAQRIVVAGGLPEFVEPDPAASARHTQSELRRAARDVGFVLETDRRRRKGPKRGPNSMQLIPDIGIDQPTPALAWMLTWRDLAIVPGRLGVKELHSKAGAWFRIVSSRQASIRKQKERIRRLGGDLEPRWQSGVTHAPARNAIIAARGAAARFAAVEAATEELLARALGRYPFAGVDSSAITLPAWDSYRYHHEVRNLAKFFVDSAAPPMNAGLEFTHRVIDRESGTRRRSRAAELSHTSGPRAGVDL